MKSAGKRKQSKDNEQPEGDFDGAWKEALRTHLQIILAIYFPDIAQLVNWEIEPVWLDKELSRVIGRAKKKARVVDLLVRVQMVSGEPLQLLLHVEVQTSVEPNFAVRLAEYNGGLKYVLHERVVTLVILGDLNVNWMPEEDRFQCGGFLSHHRFPICKLVSRLANEWQDNWSLPVILARSQIEALKTRGDPEGRLVAKYRLIRQLFELKMQRDEILSLYTLIDWMMRLRPDLEAELNQQIVLLEQEHQMPHMTSMEKQGFERGKQEGKQEGWQEGKQEGWQEGKQEGWQEGKQEGWQEGRIGLLLQLIENRFSPLPMLVKQQIESLSGTQTDALTADFFKLSSLSSLQDWLNSH